MNTLSNLPPEVAKQFCMRMLSRPMPDLIADVGNYHVMMDQNQGNTLVQSRYDNLPTQPVPLGPTGMNPPAMVMNRVDIDANLDFYGGYVAITEQVLLINQDAALENSLDLLSQSLKETDDQLIREHQVNNAPFVNCTGGSNLDNPTNMVRSDIDGVIKAFRSANCKFIMDSISGEDKYGTGPVRNAYWCKSSTDMIGNLELINGFTSAANYPNTENLLEAEWGAVSNLRFLVSSVWPVSRNASQLGNDVQNNLCQGQEACSKIELNGYSAQYRYTPPRVAGGPLWLYGTSGYVFAEVPQITNFTWITNLRCTLV